VQMSNGGLAVMASTRYGGIRREKYAADRQASFRVTFWIDVDVARDPYTGRLRICERVAHAIGSCLLCVRNGVRDYVSRHGSTDDFSR